MIVNFRDKSLDFSGETLIMGILNMTPDSFSDGGDYNNTDEAFSRALTMLEDGAKILDIGGESTRPGHTKISDEEEISRILPIIKKLGEESSAIISVDTYKSKVAEAALKAGAHIVNDIHGLQYDEKMAGICADYGAYLILMYNEECPSDMDIAEHSISYFKKSIEIAERAGIKKSHICLDPGIGFNKTHEQNLQITRELGKIKQLGYPVLYAVSRKSMIGNILNLDVKNRLEGTIVSNTVAVLNGADIIRVHDVKEHIRAMKMLDAIKNTK